MIPPTTYDDDERSIQQWRAYFDSLDRATRQGIEMVLRAIDYDEEGEGR